MGAASCAPHAMVSTRPPRPHRPDVIPLNLVPMHAQTTQKACSHSVHSAHHALVQPHRCSPLSPSLLHMTCTEIRPGQLQFLLDAVTVLLKNTLPPLPMARAEERRTQVYATALGDVRSKIRRSLNQAAGEYLCTESLASRVSLSPHSCCTQGPSGVGAVHHSTVLRHICRPV